MTEIISTDISPAEPYRVLARKYRPRDFSALIGQQAMVKTLSNAIQTGRLAHAFVLTGVRGVGKTTTARIIARALNCIGADGLGGPTIDPCGVCEHCKAIADDRHVDILEMDAASRTGVNDIREIIEGVRYRPTSARFKVYIIDEVHMLSTAAFNALLKTLEEPPEHVKFIFATTEIRKIPVTVLSRCQRFDLRRVDMDELAQHFAKIATQENAQIAEGALRLIARAADGSVRDGLSLLDQAISHGAGEVSEDQVRDMLGLADRARVFDLFEHVMKGEIGPALTQLSDQYALGADPAVVLQDMLELSHWLTRLKISPGEAELASASETERVRGSEMAQRLSMGVLSRTWQMLLKGLAEVRSAPIPLQAAEMALVRLSYAADLPTPAEMIEKLKNTPAAMAPQNGGAPTRPFDPSPSGPSASGSSELGTSAVAAQGINAAPNPTISQASAGTMGNTATARVLEVIPAPEPTPLPPMPTSFAEVVQLFTDNREGRLAVDLKSHVGLVHFEPGRIEYRPLANAPRDLAQKVARHLGEWTGRRWIVSVNDVAPAEATLTEQIALAEKKRREDATNHPLVQALMTAFPGATLDKVTDLAPKVDLDGDLHFDADMQGEDEE